MELQEALQALAQAKQDKDDISSNFAGYRKKMEAREKELTEEIETTKATLSKEAETFKKELEDTKASIAQEKETRKTSYFEKMLEEKSKGDQKIKDTLKAEYALLNMPEDTEETISARLDKAHKAAFGSVEAPSVNDAASASV
jgi:hypothetical protein